MTVFKCIQIGLIILGLIVTTACDQERPYDTVENKEKGLGLLSKSVISDHMSQTGNQVVDHKTGEKFSLTESDKIPTRNQYLTVVSTTSIDKDAPVIPYEMGREVRTVLSFTKDNLVAYEIPSQYTKTDLNFKPFLKIPISHTDFKCLEDANNRCTRKEVEDTEKTWVNKKYFKPDFTGLSLQSLDGLFSSLINYALSCSTELDSKLINYTIEEDAINITIEKTMQQNFHCAGFAAILNPSEVTYRLRQNISMVKLDSLVSPDYDPMEYRLAGPNEFGYFRTIYQERDASNRLCRTCQKDFISRWNPNKKVIDFHMSEGFSKPRNEVLRQATIQGVSMINQAFVEAGTNMKIELHDADSNLIEGDIRKNLIVMVEDPISRGLLGYGPSVTNPMTGEIVHARTVMFPGIMRFTIEGAYSEYLEVIERQEQDKINASGVLKPAEPGVDSQNIVQLGQAQRISNALGYERPVLAMGLDQVKSKLTVDSLLKDVGIVIPPPGGVVGDDSHIKLLERYFDIHGTEHAELSKELEELTKLNYYPSELFDINSSMGETIKQLIIANDYKPWDLLSAAAQEKIVNTLMPVVWIPTLIHELGHNLGLRHNFSGSNDKDNFYSKQELDDRGIKREMKYSSIMDYSYSSANELAVMGKYDVAALRFAYAEKMELTDGSFVSINAKVESDQIKPFQFCTDESVSLNANCNRFDEGTNYTEIIDHMMARYEKEYRLNNFKRNRFSFNSTGGQLGNIGRVGGMLDTMRSVFELYELIAKDNKDALERDPTLWETNPFLKDVKTATINAGLFLIEIVKTPDVHCLIGSSETLTPVAIVTLKQLSTRDASCSQVQMAPQYVVMGQAGKSFNHIRDQRNPLASVDEIDVRGIWANKMLALNTLLQRRNGSGVFDNKPFNFLIVPELQAPIMSLLVGLTTDKHRGDLVFETTFGQAVTVPWNYSMFKEGTHTLDLQYHPVVRAMFRLNNGPTQFQAMAINMIKGHAKNSFDRDIGQQLHDIFKIYRQLPNGEEEGNLSTYRIGNVKLFAYESNLVARLIIGKVNEVQKAQDLEALLIPPAGTEDPEAWIAEQTKKVENVLEVKKVIPGAVAPIDAEPIVKLAYTIDVDTLDEVLKGLLLPVSDFYEMILDSL